MSGGWSADDSKYIAIMVVIAVAVAVASAIVYFVYYFFAVRRPVPVDESAPFGVLCLSIQNADELYHEDAKSMSAAVSNLNSLISRNLFRFGSVRSLREAEVDHSEHITIIGMDTGDLIDLAIFIQKSVHQFRWGKNADAEMMEQIYHDFDDHYGVPPLSVESYKSLWGGLRIRMALHFGYGAVSTSQGALVAAGNFRELGIDSHIYGGSVVKECLFVEEHAFGGQILVSEQFRELLAREMGHDKRGNPSSENQSSPKQRTALTFVPCTQATFDDKVFASQLEIPGLEGRKHPAASSARALTALDRSKSQKRAVEFSKVSTSNSDTPSPFEGIAVVPSSSNPISNNSSNNKTVPGTGNKTKSVTSGGRASSKGTTAFPHSSKGAGGDSRHSVIVYDEDDV